MSTEPVRNDYGVLTELCISRREAKVLYRAVAHIKGDKALTKLRDKLWAFMQSGPGVTT